MQRKAGERGLAGRVRFTGPLDEAELAKQMQTSHLLALPSSYEGFGIAYLEGMGYGLPAIGTTGGGAAEIITGGVDGILIQPGDAVTLASCILALAADRRHLLRLSLAARRRFLAHPSWDVSMGEHP
jgi:glycosyltransferase involved in cell wall biosynthesis